MLTRIGEPTEVFLTLAQVKLALRISTSAEDDYLQSLIEVARQYLDGSTGILGRCLRPQTWRWDLPCGPSGKSLEVPLPPTISVDLIQYYDSNAVLQTWDSTYYRVVTGGFCGAKIVRKPTYTWPPCLHPSYGYPDVFQVTFQAGYAPGAESPTTEQIPEPIREAAILMIGDWFENRVNTLVGTSAIELPNAAAMLLAPYRMQRFG